MKSLLLSLAALFIFSLPSVASAETITFQAPATASDANGNAGSNPGGTRQFDLDHYNAYTWSITNNFAAGTTITGATMTFSNISNWDNNPNRLYVNMLDYARNASNNYVDRVQDNTVDPTRASEFNDYFDSSNALANGAEKIDITTLANLTTTASTMTYTFNAAQLAKLNEFFSVTDNTLAFGFDPDCHFWNNGITFSVTTANNNTNAPVPEPATMMLLGTGLAGIAAKMRRRKGNADAEGQEAEIA